MSFKIAYGAGHHLYTPGKRLPRELDPTETREWVLNNRIAEAFAEAARQYEGVELLRVDDPTGEEDITIQERCRIANRWKADFCLSIHHNAAGRVFDGGGLVVYWSKPEDEAWARAIYGEIIAAGGIRGNRSNPVPDSRLYVPRTCEAPCALIEAGFMDSRVDYAIILTEAHARMVGCAAMEAIAKMAKLTRKPDAAGKEEGEMVRYQTIEEVPDYARPTIEKLIADGSLKGAGDNQLDLSQDMVRTLVILDRRGNL